MVELFRYWSIFVRLHFVVLRIKRDAVYRSIDNQCFFISCLTDNSSALERTYLGYMRTSTVFATIGVTVAQVFRLKNEGAIDPPFGFFALGIPLACAFIGSALVISVLGSWRFGGSRMLLQEAEYMPVAGRSIWSRRLQLLYVHIPNLFSNAKGYADGVCSLFSLYWPLYLQQKPLIQVPRHGGRLRSLLGSIECRALLRLYCQLFHHPPSAINL